MDAAGSDHFIWSGLNGFSTREILVGVGTIDLIYKVCGMAIILGIYCCVKILEVKSTQQIYEVYLPPIEEPAAEHKICIDVVDIVSWDHKIRIDHEDFDLVPRRLNLKNIIIGIRQSLNTTVAMFLDGLQEPKTLEQKGGHAHEILLAPPQSETSGECMPPYTAATADVSYGTIKAERECFERKTPSKTVPVEWCPRAPMHLRSLCESLSASYNAHLTSLKEPHMQEATTTGDLESMPPYHVAIVTPAVAHKPTRTKREAFESNSLPVDQCHPMEISGESPSAIYTGSRSLEDLRDDCLVESDDSQMIELEFQRDGDNVTLVW